MIRAELWNLSDERDADGFSRYEWAGQITVADGVVEAEGEFAEELVALHPDEPWRDMKVLPLDVDHPVSLRLSDDPDRWLRFLPYSFRTPYIVCEIVQDDNPWQPPEDEDNDPIEVTLDLDRRIQALVDAQDEAILNGTASADEQALTLGRVVAVRSTRDLLAEAKERRARELGEEA